MKKLMTLVSAVALAFGLRAVDTGTSFEGMSAGDLDITSSTGELSNESGFWVTNGNETVKLDVIDGESVDRNSENTIPQYLAASQDRYLSVKSAFGNPITRKIKTGNAGQTIGNGFYFDSQVKFTAFDDDPMTTAVTNDFDGAKIAVWAREVYDGEVVTGTNLFIRAGYLGGEPVSYDCGGLPNPGAWHRLTIKAIANIYSSGEQSVPGFVVFIDGQPIRPTILTTKGIVAANLSDKYEGYYNAGALYPSMVQDGSEDALMLSSVAFDGQGDVDDIVFTETAPAFAKDAEYVYVNWTPADIATLAIDGTALTSEEIAEGSYKVTFEDNLAVEVSATYVEGKLAGTWTTTGSATVEDDTFTFTEGGETGTIVAAAAAASFQGTPYATLDGAIAAAEEASATLPPPFLKLYNTSESDDIDITPQTLIVIDLNGQEIGGITSTKALKIIDPVGGGTVKGEVELGDESVIDAGTFDDIVTLGDGSVVNGGRFDLDMNEGSIEEFAAAGYEFVAGTGADEGYLVLVEKPVEFDFTVSAGENSYVSEVLIDNVDVTEAVTNGTLEVITTNKSWSVTFTANSGYEFEGGLTTTNFTGIAEAAVEVEGPDASSTSPEEPTIEPGETSVDNVPASSEADATNKVVVASPDSTVVSDAEYKEYFTLTAQETAPGLYTVSIEINKEAIELPETLEDVGGDLQDAAAAFGEDENASFTGIAAKPGLYYWIDTAPDPAFTENVTHGVAVFATSDTVNLVAVKPENVENGVFFRVCVDAGARD